MCDLKVKILWSHYLLCYLIDYQPKNLFQTAHLNLFCMTLYSMPIKYYYS